MEVHVSCMGIVVEYYCSMNPPLPSIGRSDAYGELSCLFQGEKLELFELLFFRVVQTCVVFGD